MQQSDELPSWADLLGAVTGAVAAVALAGPTLPGFLLCVPGLVLVVVPVVIAMVVLGLLAALVASALALLALPIVVGAHALRVIRARAHPGAPRARSVPVAPRQR